MSKQDLRLLEYVKPGDLIAVDCCDASTGKSSMNGGVIDVPVRGHLSGRNSRVHS